MYVFSSFKFGEPCPVVSVNVLRAVRESARSHRVPWPVKAGWVKAAGSVVQLVCLYIYFSFIYFEALSGAYTCMIVV